MITHMEVTGVKLRAPKRKVKSETNSNAYCELDLHNKLPEMLEKISLLFLNKVIFVYSQLFSIYLSLNLALSTLFFPAVSKKLIQIDVLFHNNFLSPIKHNN